MFSKKFYRKHKIKFQVPKLHANTEFEQFGHTFYII